jgi:hypothetical protein
MKLSFSEAWKVINSPIWVQTWGQIDGQVSDRVRCWVVDQIAQIKDPLDRQTDVFIMISQILDQARSGTVDV